MGERGDRASGLRCTFRTGHRGLGVCHALREIRYVRLGLLSGSLLERNDAGRGFGPFFIAV